MRAIASARINHPHGPQEHHFGTRHERAFSYHLWCPILQIVQSRSRFFRCREVHNLFLSGVSVYPPCTSLGQIRCFYSFCRLVESASCVVSVGFRIPIPPAGTIPIRPAVGPARKKQTPWSVHLDAPINRFSFSSGACVAIFQHRFGSVK